VVGYSAVDYVPYSTTEYVTTDAYPAPATTYVAPETVYAPPAERTTQPVQPPDQEAPDFSEEQRKTVMDGNAAFSAGRYEEARDLYVRAVLTDGRDGYAKMLYAWSNFALGDFTTAAASLRRALVTTPELIDYPMDLRTMYSDASVLPTQTERLVRYISENPPNADAELLLAYLHYSIGEAQRAADSFKRTAAADANDKVAAKLHQAATRAARGQTSPPAKQP
jgi:tetratricopeptide (TPR) repeat protein